MTKLTVALIGALALITLGAGYGCEEHSETVCKNRAQASCVADDRCKWVEKEDGTALCKAAE